jgi:hypothetical protein
MSMSKINVSKLDASKRQVDTAIKLFFGEGDPVSIHTLTEASYEILECLMKAKGDFPIAKDVELYIKDEHQKEALKMMNKPRNFFKHGSRDANETIEFNPRSTTFLLWDAVRMYMKLTNGSSIPMQFYMTWFYLKNIDFLKEGEYKQKLQICRSRLNPDDKETILAAIEISEKQGFIVE